MKKKLEKILTRLQDIKIRVTPVREKILMEFVQTRHSMSHAEILNRINNQFDRVTVYRTLNLFCKIKLLHKIKNESPSTYFALNPDFISQSGDKHSKHIHFSCRLCGQIFCLDNNINPKFKLPDSFLIDNYEISAQGTCANCKI